jgi:preprotein translocase subunit SecA
LGIHYIVRDAKVMIVDENTGRVMPDRSWERGLHQLIEIKEGVELTPPKETMAKLSFQLFFRRFLQLSGMSGTCQELASELHRVYGVGVISIPSRLPSQRRCVGRYVFRTAAERDAFAVQRVLSCQQKQQPVLVGTRSVNSSEGLSQLLVQQGVRHAVLNANQDADEANVVAQAGELAQVTIATNMAGRGTDIHLAQGVAELGGLHVLMIERNDNARIDRQLVGRCARQGDPGSWEMLLSLEDELLNGFYEPLTGFFQAMLELFPRSRVLQWLLLGYYRLAQRRREKMHRRMRDTLQKSDMQMRQALSFSGKME